MTFFTFEPTIFEPLYKTSTNGKKINKWTVEVQDNKYRTISGYDDGKQTKSEWTVCQSKNLGKRNETTGAQQALAEAQALYRKRQEKGYNKDITKAGTKIYFEPMLAYDYKEKKDEVYYPCFSQPKLDGIRCIAKEDGLWTRNGKEIVSCPHIYHSLKHLFNENPNLILDGELYADKFATDFDSLTSIVKKTKPTSEDLQLSREQMQYWVYDCPSVDDVFEQRYLELTKLDFGGSGYFQIVETHFIFNENEILPLYNEYVEKGYEGQIIRLNEPYQNKRTKYLLKHKSFINEEYTILGIEEGEGNRTGMVGKMHFLRDGEPFKANVKASWPRLKQMWNERDELIGKEATVKYFNLTPRGVPRFGYVVAIRDYE